MKNEMFIEGAIYIVTYEVDCEGGSIEGVFLHRKDAVAFINKYDGVKPFMLAINSYRPNSTDAMSVENFFTPRDRSEDDTQE